MTNYSPADLARFWSKVDKAGPCWLWIASLSTPGYGQMKVGPKVLQAHRISYEIARGPIPEGLVIDHLCRVPACVNPSHLEAVTQRENMLRGTAPAAASRRGVCQRGHKWEPGSWPGCHTCHRERRLERRAKQKLLGNV